MVVVFEIAESIEDGSEAEVPLIVFLHTVIRARFGAELLVVGGDTAYHGAFEIEPDLLLAGEFDGFEDQ